MLARLRESQKHATHPAATDNTSPPAPRKELESPLIVLNVRDGSPRTFFGYASNISSGGMRIAATSPREPGGRYRLEIPLPTSVGPTTECECEVVWRTDYTRGYPVGPGMGLKFLDLPPKVARALDSWIRRDTFESLSRSSER